jgi:membrane protein DedA with SNARE-associated domain
METSIWGSILDIIYRLGSPGIVIAMVLEGLGVPFPGDIVMAGYGFLAAKGHFPFMTVYLASILGCWVGSWVSFYLGKRYGISFLHKFGRIVLMTETHIRHSQELSRNHAMLILTLGRFLPGVRTVSSYVAGIGEMDWAAFLLLSLLGFGLWCFTWVGIGYWVGDHWQEIVHTINTYLLLVLAAGFGLAAIYAIWKRKRHRNG